MKNCDKCGQELPDQASFCFGCGAPVAGAGEAGSSASEAAGVSGPSGPGMDQADTGSADTGRSGDDRTGPAGNSDRKTELRFGPVYGADLENLPPGYVVDDRYEIKQKVGQGGFGAVYRVHDRKMDIDKALKVLPKLVAEDKRSMDTLLAEARTMVRLNHANIVRLYEINDQGAVKYLDMEFVAGGSLADRLYDAPDKRLPEKAVRAVALQVAAGLAYAHDNGVIHKDIKPQNVLLAVGSGKKTGAGSGAAFEAKVMDFGISETVRTSLSRLSNTSSSGTLVYMSPEQIRGKDVGREADIYSFGAMLYELLPGRPPFYKGAIEHQILNEPPEPIDGVSVGMNAFLQKCLAKDYKDRFRSFEEVIAALKAGRLKPSPASASAKTPASATGRSGDLSGASEPSSDVSAPSGAGAIFGSPAPGRLKPSPVTAREKNAGKLFTNDLGMEFVWIEPGSFMMGSPAGIFGIRGDERQHQVTLTSGFYMQTTVVTQGQWQKVMGGNPSHFSGFGDNCPVECVSWFDVQDFIHKLNSRTGGNYRLPTEAEWEYACRAGSTTRFCFGDSKHQLKEFAWFIDNAGSQTHPVGEKKPNAWGLYDMHGNVFERVADWYAKYPPESVSDPIGPSKGTSRVHRGGSWRRNAWDCRSAYRDRRTPDIRSNYLGFRLAAPQVR